MRPWEGPLVGPLFQPFSGYFRGFHPLKELILVVRAHYARLATKGLCFLPLESWIKYLAGSTFFRPFLSLL